MKTVLRDIKSIRPYDKNPRKNDAAVDTVARSISDFGFRQPVVIDRHGIIIAGHTRYKAALKLGLKKIPVHIAADLTPEQANAYRLADNKAAELAEWDMELLTVELDSLKQSGIDLDWLDFELPAPAARDGFTDPDSVPDTAPPRTKPGELWILGNHRLLCGDCTKNDQVAKLVKDKTVNIAFTSPPYAEQREYDRESGFKPIPPDKYVDWFSTVAENVKQYLAPDGSWFVNIKPSASGLDTELYVFDLVIAHVRNCGWHFATEFCWERTGIPKSVSRRFKNQFEPIYQFTLGDWKMRPDSVRHESDAVPKPRGKGVGNTSWGKHQGGGLESINMSQKQGTPDFKWFGDDISNGLAYPGNRLPTFTGSHEALGHSAAFPVGLPEFFIKAFTDPGDIVFDPFIGSGSTMIAAEKIGRHCLGMEISPVYCDVIIKRWEDFTHQKAVLDNPKPKARRGRKTR